MEQFGKKKKELNLFLLLLIVFLFSALSGYGRLTNYLSAGLLVIIIPNSIKYVPKTMLRSFGALAFFLAFYFITSLTNYSSLYYLLGTCILYTLVTFGPFFIRIYLERENDIAFKKKLFFWATLLWLCIVLVSVATYSGSEEGGRDFANDHKGLLLGGGYGSAYASAILGVICFYYLLSGKKSLSKKVKWLLAAGCLLCGMHVFYTMSTITIVALILGCLLSLFFCTPKEKKLHLGAVVFSLLFIVGVFYFLFNSESIGLWMMKASRGIENELFSKRMAEVGNFLYSEQETNHMGNRLYTLRSSWQTFLTHPILGVGYKYGNTYELLYQNGVGVHSEFLDSFAKYGIVGAVPYLYFFYLQLKSLAQKSKFRLILPVAAAFLIMFVFNPFLSVQTIFMLCLYLPLVIDLLERQEKEGGAEGYED